MTSDPKWLLKVGLGLMVVAGLAIQILGSVVPLQRSTSPAQFADAALDAGARVRISGLFDIFGFVPGFTLVGIALFALAGWRAGAMIVGAAAIIDQLENLTLQAGLWGFDGETPPNPSEELITALRIFNTLKWSLLLLSVVVLAGAYLRRKFRSVDAQPQ